MDSTGWSGWDGFFECGLTSVSSSPVYVLIAAIQVRLDYGAITKDTQISMVWQISLSSHVTCPVRIRRGLEFMVITQGPCRKEAPSYLSFHTHLRGQRELSRDSHKQSNALAQKWHLSQLTGLNWSHDPTHQEVQRPLCSPGLSTDTHTQFTSIPPSHCVQGRNFSEDKVKVLVTQSHPILCDPMACSPPGSSVHGISQAKILEWVAISFFRGIFPTQGSNPGPLSYRQILYRLSPQRAQCQTSQSNT